MYEQFENMTDCDGCEPRWSSMDCALGECGNTRCVYSSSNVLRGAYPKVLSEMYTHVQNRAVIGIIVVSIVKM